MAPSDTNTGLLFVTKDNVKPYLHDEDALPRELEQAEVPGHRRRKWQRHATEASRRVRPPRASLGWRVAGCVRAPPRGEHPRRRDRAVVYFSLRSDAFYSSRQRQEHRGDVGADRAHRGRPGDAPDLRRDRPLGRQRVRPRRRRSSTSSPPRSARLPDLGRGRRGARLLGALVGLDNGVITTFLAGAVVHHDARDALPAERDHAAPARGHPGVHARRRARSSEVLRSQPFEYRLLQLEFWWALGIVLDAAVRAHLDALGPAHGRDRRQPDRRGRERRQRARDQDRQLRALQHRSPASPGILDSTRITTIEPLQGGARPDVPRRRGRGDRRHVALRRLRLGDRRVHRRRSCSSSCAPASASSASARSRSTSIIGIAIIASMIVNVQVAAGLPEPGEARSERRVRARRDPGREPREELRRGHRARRRHRCSSSRAKCLGLIGDNGAGKSTLVKILSGFHRPDAGRIFVDGEEVSLRSVDHARSLGIDTVYQDLALVPTLSVAHNMFLNRELTRRRRAVPVAQQPARCAARARVHRGHRHPHPALGARRRSRMLSGGQRQAIAIARSVHSGAQDPAPGRAARRDGREGGRDDPRPDPRPEGEGALDDRGRAQLRARARGVRPRQPAPARPDHARQARRPRPRSRS